MTVWAALCVIHRQWITCLVCFMYWCNTVSVMVVLAAEGCLAWHRLSGVYVCVALMRWPPNGCWSWSRVMRAWLASWSYWLWETPSSQPSVRPPYLHTTPSLSLPLLARVWYGDNNSGGIISVLVGLVVQGLFPCSWCHCHCQGYLLITVIA